MSFLSWNNYFFNISRIRFRQKFWLHNFSAILFPTNFPIASAVLWTTFYCRRFSLHFALFLWQRHLIFSDICVIIFLQMTEIYTFWHVFLFLVLQNHVSFLSNVRLFLSSISNLLLFWSVNLMIISSNSVF